MPTLFIRTLIVYAIMFAVLRLMGKRQINEMQPFDLAVTLLIANLASLPMSEPQAPLVYGIVPMIALFIVQRLVSFASLKSERVRKLVCGSALVLIERGVVQESVMRAANYSLSDLLEQLRLKDVFSVSDVEYAILETNGSLSVLLKAELRQPTVEQLSLEAESGQPAYLLVADGKVHEAALYGAGLTRERLLELLLGLGIASPRECLFASLAPEGVLHVQRKQRGGESVRAEFLKLEGENGEKKDRQ